MAQRVWSAAELEQLSPAEQDAIFTAGIVRDLADVPPEVDDTCLVLAMDLPMDAPRTG